MPRRSPAGWRRPAAASSFFAIGLLVAAFAAPARADPAASADALRWSDAVLAALRTGIATSIDARLDDNMRAALPGGSLVSVFESLHARVGVLGACVAPSTRTSGEVAIVEQRCAFANGPQTVRTAWTSNGRLAGLFVVPAPADVALPPGVREESVVTGSAGWPLPGSLLIPPRTGASTAAGPPIAVLVHGSGPNDRDETVGANKPFRDLAFGLAERGIGTLRYEKRTRAFGKRFAARADWTVDDEVVDDAVAALTTATLRGAGAPVFLVGHSEGALLAPRIAAAAKARGVAVAGVVMLAAPLTPLADLELEQLAYLSGLADTAVTAAMVDDARTRRENLRALVAGTGPASAPLPLGAPASFWLDLSRYDPAATLLDQPLLPALLTFGGRDYQVPIREKALWEARLGARAGTTIVAFPSLNHLLIDGRGPMSPAEYAMPGHVAPALIDAIGEWMRRQAQASR